MPPTSARDARGVLAAALATWLFLGALRQFFSAIYYQNLATLSLNATALYAFLLLAPALLLVPGLRAFRQHAAVGGIVALALARLVLPFTPGSALHLPLAGIAAAGYLVALPALATRESSGAGAGSLAAGFAVGAALDLALLAWARSDDPTARLEGVLLVTPAAALLLFLTLTTPPPADVTSSPPPRRVWRAGFALGGALFLQHAVLGSAHAVARWSEAHALLALAALLVGLLAGAWLAADPPGWGGLLALHIVGLSALALHGALASPWGPLLLAATEAMLVVDLALALGHVASSPLAAARAVTLGAGLALVLHFVFAFTFLFHYVPLGNVWKGQEDSVVIVAGVLLWAARKLAPARAASPHAARRAAALVATAPLLVGIVAAATPAAAIDAPEPGGIVTLLTFNVHQGFSNAGVVDPEVFVRVLEEADADIVVLQEADTPRFTSANLDVVTYLAARLGYHEAYGQPTREQAFGGAILSRHPIAEWKAVRLPSDSDNRWFTEARVVVDGRDVWLYAVHFALPQEDRLAQTDTLLAYAAKRPAPRILAGDFNSCPEGLCPREDEPRDDVYARLTATHRDAWTAAGHAVDDARGLTYDAADPYERIDYVFVTNDISVRSAEVMRTDAALAASDHLPVLVRFTVD